MSPRWIAGAQILELPFMASQVYLWEVGVGDEATLQARHSRMVPAQLHTPALGLLPSAYTHLSLHTHPLRVPCVEVTFSQIALFSGPVRVWLWICLLSRCRKLACSLGAVWAVPQ